MTPSPSIAIVGCVWPMSSFWLGSTQAVPSAFFRKPKVQSAPSRDQMLFLLKQHIDLIPRTVTANVA
jgi:hypothetical protein